LPSFARPHAKPAAPQRRRWRRALTWGSLLLVLANVVTCAGGMLRGIHQPFWTLYGMAQVAMFMEFHDRGLPEPSALSSSAPGSRLVPCFRNGAADPALSEEQDCHPGLFQGEGSYVNPFVLWSEARVSGLVMPTFLMQTGIGERLLAYAEKPCRALRDFDRVVMPPRQAQMRLAWLAQEMGVIRQAFDCEGDGRLRPEQRDRWEETAFRLHLYDASGEVVSVLHIAPAWTPPGSAFAPADWIGNRADFRFLPDQFPSHTPSGEPES
jgi:hypothetical protein